MYAVYLYCLPHLPMCRQTNWLGRSWSTRALQLNFLTSSASGLLNQDAATLLHEELDGKRRCELEKPGWTAFCSRKDCRKKIEEGVNRPYIGRVTSQVMGLRLTNSSWNLCLLSVFTPLCDVEAPWETEFLYSGRTPHWTCGFRLWFSHVGRNC